MKLSMLALGAALSFTISAQSASAQYGEKDAKKPDAKAMQDDPAAMMEQYAELSKPGAEHKLLDPFVGEWEVKATFWMDPAATEPMHSTGKAKTEWSLDGHYQRQTYHGEFMGEKFTGESILGYNKVTGEYFSTWIDSMSTAMATGTGKVDSTGKTFTFNGSYDDPMSGGKTKTRDVMQVKNKNEYTMISYMQMPDGSEFKHMVLEYKRTW